MSPGSLLSNYITGHITAVSKVAGYWSFYFNGYIGDKVHCGKNLGSVLSQMRLVVTKGEVSVIHSENISPSLHHILGFLCNLNLV